jgi:hypothetical protein
MIRVEPMLRTYTDLSQIETFEERYFYLELKGRFGEQTFGFDRWLNQRFYKSKEWKTARDFVIYRDQGCDLGIPGYEIYSGLLVHHMNPLTKEDLEGGSAWIFDPNYLITTTLQTHNAIHFGDVSHLPRGPITREAGDTKLW